MKNALKQIQDRLSPQHTYYFQIQLDHLILSEALITSLSFKDSYIQILVMKDKKLIASTPQPIHSTILGQKLFLNMVKLKFSATLYDIQRNLPIILKIIKIQKKTQQQAAQFKLIPAKYVECFNVEQKSYFFQKFASKLGLSIEVTVCIQKNRVKLQNLIQYLQTERKRKRSQSAKKTRMKSPFMRKMSKIKQSQIQHQEQLKKSTIPKIQLKKSVNNQPKMVKSYSQNKNNKTNEIYQRNVGKTVLKNSCKPLKINQIKEQLKISKITQLNSQQYSELSRSFSNSPIFFQKQNVDQLYDQLDQHKQSQIISQLSEHTSKQLQSQKISLYSAQQSNVFSGQSSSLSRSVGIVQSQTEDSTSVNSSRISTSSDLNNFKQKRNRTCYIILLILAAVLLINAIIPSAKFNKKKKLH